ncbi:exodeoxyribonuclease VII small subunit [Fontimonas sp. SYSU GA230001]|uniref:exodeoxyribonuclease VII small subunit n=1 Tax=Fontimonas sp. SYSU GA230001 TaxID=3142450 RepID=UPI0032B4F95A
MARKQEPVEAHTDPVGRFEDSMKELESIVQSLERGDLRLEESLQLFERGVELARQCRSALDSAEQKVRNLLDAQPGQGDAT